MYSLLLLSVTRIEELGTSVPLIRNQSQMFFVLLLVDVVTGARHEVKRARPTRYQAVRWTADGTLMAITDAPDADMMRLCRLDPATGATVPVFAPLFRDVDAWAVSPDGSRIAIGAPGAAGKASQPAPMISARPLGL